MVVNEIRVNGRTPVILSTFENHLPWQLLHETLALDTENAAYYDMRQL